jgi:hypothetical protein
MNFLIKRSKTCKEQRNYELKLETDNKILTMKLGIHDSELKSQMCVDRKNLNEITKNASI